MFNLLPSGKVSLMPCKFNSQVAETTAHHLHPFWHEHGPDFTFKLNTQVVFFPPLQSAFTHAPSDPILTDEAPIVFICA